MAPARLKRAPLISELPHCGTLFDAAWATVTLVLDTPAYVEYPRAAVRAALVVQALEDRWDGIGLGREDILVSTYQVPPAQERKKPTAEHAHVLRSST